MTLPKLSTYCAECSWKGNRPSCHGDAGGEHIVLNDIQTYASGLEKELYDALTNSKNQTEMESRVWLVRDNLLKLSQNK